MSFYECDALRTLTIPDSVTTIGKRAFQSCKGLTSVTISNSVNTISERSFYFCLSLASVAIPNSVTAIGKGAFQFCNSLESVTIPNSVTTIGEEAFSDCNSLTLITIPGIVTDYNIKNLEGNFGNHFFKALIRSSANIKSLPLPDEALAKNILSFLKPQDVSRNSLASKSGNRSISN